jgi:hypothetical protein
MKILFSGESSAMEYAVGVILFLVLVLLSNSYCPSSSYTKYAERLVHDRKRGIDSQQVQILPPSSLSASSILEPAYSPQPTSVGTDLAECW